jgi:hypothetical protein
VADLVRLLGAVAALAGVLLLAALVEPGWAADLGLDVNEFLSVAPVTRIPDPSPAELEALGARLAAKRRVTQELLDGRLTLFEAAALFRRLNLEAGGALARPEYTDAERVCRDVIAWAHTELAQGGDAARADACADRLTEELRRHKAGHGKVVLPDPSRVCLTSLATAETRPVP